MKIYKLNIIGVSLVLSASFLMAEAKEVHSQVSERVTISADGKLSFEFEVKTKLAMNWEAPWLLQLNKYEHLSFDKVKFKRGDMDDKLPGFKIATKSKPGGDKGTLDYKLIAFVCTKDKSKCFRDVHKGSFAWAASN